MQITPLEMSVVADDGRSIDLQRGPFGRSCSSKSQMERGRAERERDRRTGKGNDE